MDVCSGSGGLGPIGFVWKRMSVVEAKSFRRVRSGSNVFGGCGVFRMLWVPEKKKKRKKNIKQKTKQKSKKKATDMYRATVPSRVLR